MQTVSPAYSQAWTEDNLYVGHKVIVEFGSNRFNDGQVITASSTKVVNQGLANDVRKEDVEFWKPSEVFNNKNRNTMKWLVCDQGAKAQQYEDGSGYRAIDLNADEYERGWWSAVKSDGTGSFGTPQFVQSEFFEEDGTTPFQRRVNKITLYLTEGYRTMKEVTVAYKHPVNGWTSIATNYQIPDETYEVTWDYPGDLIITGLRITVHKTWNVSDFARVSELQGYYIEDISDDVINIDIRESREEYESTVPVGTTAANTVSVTLDNTTGRYNIKNEESDLYPYIASNNRVEVYFGIDISDGAGTHEYTQMGEFWTDEWQDEGGSMTANFSGRDFSKFLQDEQSTFSRVWTATNIKSCFVDIMARAGKMPGEQINIDTAALRGFDILFIKEQDIWSFMQEIAFADQGMFGFDRNGDFYYHSYNRLNTTPYDTSVYEIRFDRNIVEGTIQSEIYTNKVIAKVSPVNLDETGKRAIWSANDTILQWSKLASNITASATTIPVTAATGQATGNLTANLWDDVNGYFWLPTINAAGEVTAAEVVKYKSRTDSAFTGCERGMFGTEAKSHTSGAYIGEVAAFDIEFDNAPALKVQFPKIAAIDVLPKLQDPDGGPAQAFVIAWEHTPFGGKLVVGNKVNFKTPLVGTLETYYNYKNGNAADDELYEWYTLIVGEVSVQDEGREEVIQNAEITAENKDYIRRYGKNELTVDNMWVQSKKHAQDLADIIIDEFRNPRQIVRLQCILPSNLELGDRVNIINYPQLDIEGIEYHIISADWQYDGGLQVSLGLREIKP